MEWQEMIKEIDRIFKERNKEPEPFIMGPMGWESIQEFEKILAEGVKSEGIEFKPEQLNNPGWVQKEK